MCVEQIMAVLASFLNGAIDSTDFTFKDNVFSAEASDFKGRNVERQIYDDACDVGIAIRSVITGAVIKFFLHDIVKDAEDILYWEYHPCYEDVRKHGVRDLRVKIFND